MNNLPYLCQSQIVRHLRLPDLSAVLRLNSEWLYVAAAILYRDPFWTLQQLSLAFGWPEEEHQERFYSLLRLLLGCCGKQQLVFTTVDTLQSPPSFDYLSLYRSHRARMWFFLEQCAWVSPEEMHACNYDQVLVALASHSPQTISQLHISLEHMDSYEDLIPQLCSLRRLELYSGEANHHANLAKFLSRHLRTHQDTLQELELSGPSGHNFLRSGHPLLLDDWTNLRRLNLSSWCGILDWRNLPRARLTELHINVQSMLAVPFDPLSFLQPCSNLQALHLLGVSDSTFDWARSEAGHEILPQLTTLEIGGPRVALRRCIIKALASFSASLLFLTITLQEPAGGAFEIRTLTWNTRLPKLTRLTIKDKTVFEIDPVVLSRCPSLRELTIDIHAEQARPGCIGLGSPWVVKWTKIPTILTEMRPYVGRLQAFSMKGCWICGESQFLLLIASMTQLKRLHISYKVLQLTSLGLLSVVERLEHLSLLEVSRHLVEYDQSTGTRNSILKPGLEVRLLWYTIGD